MDRRRRCGLAWIRSLQGRGWRCEYQIISLCTLNADKVMYQWHLSDTGGREREVSEAR